MSWAKSDYETNLIRNFATRNTSKMYKYNEVSPDIVQYHPQIYYSYHLSHKQDAILP